MARTRQAMQRISSWLQGREASARHLSRRVSRRTVLVVTLVVVLFSGVLAELGPLGLGIGPGAQAQGKGDHPTNRFDPRSHATSVPPRRPKAKPGTEPPHKPVRIGRPTGGSMKTGVVALHPDQPSTFLGSDGRLEVDVPAGAVTTAEVSAASGALQLRIAQVSPASGSTDGGIVSFGTYLIQVVDAHGVLVPSSAGVAQGLHQPITVRLHYTVRDTAAGILNARATINGQVPIGTAGAPLAGATGTGGTSGGSVTLGAFSTQGTEVDTGRQTVGTRLRPRGPSTAVSFNTDSPVASYGKPDPFNADLSAGALSGSIPIDVPAGPGGLTPPISLSYSSAGVSEAHNPQASAPWVGEGWNLGLGSISWSEHDSNASCTSGCGNGWEDTWQLSDPFGTSAELIPPTILVATYWEDSVNPISSQPIRWYSAPETHARIYSFWSGLTLPEGGGFNPPCWRVFLPNGIMEEFGCTADSLEYYWGGGHDFISTWNLDLITDRHGNQIHLTYRQHTATCLDPQGGSHSCIRAAEVQTIEWDSPTCQNAQTACTTGGTAPNQWAPRLRVYFSATHAPTRLTGTPPTGCNTGTNMRCDNPITITNGLKAPDAQSTFVLNDIFVEVYDLSIQNWQNLRDYQLSYDQKGPTTITDPASGSQQSISGRLLLTQLVQKGSDGTTALPARTFTYVRVYEYYTDTVRQPTPTTLCNPGDGTMAWNTGIGSGCLLWSRSYESNGYYLSTADNGLGMQATFSWANARNNTHGVNGGGANTADPLYCNGLTAQQQAAVPCNEADDEDWSHVVLTQEQEVVKRNYQMCSPGPPPFCSGTTELPIYSTTSYFYKLTYPLAAQQCSDCVAGMYWGNQNDGDYADYYNAKFMGFAQVDVYHPDGSKDTHKFHATKGFGVYSADVATNACMAYFPPCRVAPWSDVTNAAHGHEYEVDSYDVDATTLLKKMTTQYAVTCPPSGVVGSPSWSTTVNGHPYTYTWDGKRVSELDHGNPVAVCDIQTAQTDAYTYDGGASPVHSTTTYTHDSYGRQTTAVSTHDGTATSPTQIVQNTVYVWHDETVATLYSVTGTYLINFPAQTYVSDTTASGYTKYSCTYTHYDGHAYDSGEGKTWLLLGEVTATDTYPDCGTATNGYAPNPSDLIETTTVYDSYGNPVATKDPDANAPVPVPGHVGCTYNSVQYTSCTTYDDIFKALPVSTANVLNQTSSIAYGYSYPAIPPPPPPELGGFGLWPTSTTDANGQKTSFGYDALGRMTNTTLPVESGSLTTKTRSYTVWCTATGAQSPCIEIDETQRLDDTHTVTTRSFYDGFGRLAEMRTHAPNNQDAVVYYFYDAPGRQVFQSVPYYVTAYTGAAGPGAFSSPDTGQVGSSTTYVSHLQTKVFDPYAHQTKTTESVACSVQGTSDTACYVQTLTLDPLAHQRGTLTDGFGHVAFTQTYTGWGAPYTLYATVRHVYDYLGREVQTWQPNASTAANATTLTYDKAGHLTTLADADLGTWTYTYDQNGNQRSSVDPRGSGTNPGTVYIGYDGLNRPLWRNASDTPTGAYATSSYDSTAGGNKGVGRLTGETFNAGASLGAGSYSYTYDGRGRKTAASVSLGGSIYPFGFGFDDADHPTTLDYSDGEHLSFIYDLGSGWLTSASTTLSGVTTLLLSTVTYTGTAGGAFGRPTGAIVGNGTYDYTATYDSLGRSLSAGLKRHDTGATLFNTARSYDADGNVLTVNTILGASGNTDNQVFCYDEFNRLTFARATTTSLCGVPNTGGTLTSAQYAHNFTYDVYDRLTSGPLGSYTYGDSAHLHAATAAGSAYTATYDVAGDMACRAPTSATTCAGGGPTGAPLSYDNERRLTHWQNAPSSPTSTADFRYDGAGSRVVQQANGTTTYYLLGGLEEVTGGVVTKYLGVGSLPSAVRVGSTLSYLATDGLGSVSLALDGAGNATAQQLYAPYGSVRYSSGTMPTAKGFTGQRQDAVSGLDYYNARYYDPVLGQFTSADSVMQGLNHFAYVAGNPETATDPTGHSVCQSSCGSGGGGDYGGNCYNDATCRTMPPPDKHNATTYCRGQASLCRKINTTFDDDRTRALLYLLLLSGTGVRFLDFLFQAVKAFGGDGDNFIQWGDTGGYKAYNDIFGHITLNPSKLLTHGGDLRDYIEATGALIHEAVEVYYNFRYAIGLTGVASQHLEYVADHFGDTVKYEIGVSLDAQEVPVRDLPGRTDAMDKSFDDWQANANCSDGTCGPRYDDQVTTQPELVTGSPENMAWVILYAGGKVSGLNSYYEQVNPGLTFGMLASDSLVGV